ncbi:hypothetical protein N7530_006995 [Penicillium desertorum]|uniref:Uncharacterized protein n=1 Tax=Penicillium desertorum TaxID=1303715 RepID=A0A9W9WSR2_9EURO|nr:hypothetical protein N7530_006995 [Penicillium desertorum]
MTVWRLEHGDLIPSIPSGDPNVGRSSAGIEFGSIRLFRSPPSIVTIPTRKPSEKFKKDWTCEPFGSLVPCPREGGKVR